MSQHLPLPARTPTTVPHALSWPCGCWASLYATGIANETEIDMSYCDHHALVHRAACREMGITE